MMEGILIYLFIGFIVVSVHVKIRPREWYGEERWFIIWLFIWPLFLLCLVFMGLSFLLRKYVKWLHGGK